MEQGQGSPPICCASATRASGVEDPDWPAEVVAKMLLGINPDEAPRWG